MNKPNLEQLEKRLRNLPKPPLEKEKVRKMAQKLIRQANQTNIHEKKTWKPLLAGLAGIAACALFAVLIFSNSGNEHVPKTASPPPPAKQEQRSPQIVPSSQKVVDEWAAAVKERNGKIQFNLLSAALQQKVKEPLQQTGFQTGQSSPWVSSYEITSQLESRDKAIYTVTFHLATSTGDAGNDDVELILMLVNNNWVITTVSLDGELFPYSQAQTNDNSPDANGPKWEQLSRSQRLEGTVLSSDQTTITMKVTKNLPFDTDPADYPKPGYTIKLNILDPVAAGFLQGKMKKGETIIASVATYMIGDQQIEDGTSYTDLFVKNAGLFYDVNRKAKAFLGFQPVSSLRLVKGSPEKGWKMVSTVDIVGGSAKKVSIYTDQKDLYAFIEDNGEVFSVGKVGEDGKDAVEVDQGQRYRFDEMANQIIITSRNQLTIIGYSDHQWVQYFGGNNGYGQVINVDGMNDDEIVDTTDKDHLILYRWVGSENRFVKVNIADFLQSDYARLEQSGNGQWDILIGDRNKQPHTMSYNGIGIRVLGELTEK